MSRIALIAAAGACLVASSGGSASVGRGVSRTASLTITRFRLTVAPVAITVAARSVWVVEETTDERADLVRLDPNTGELRARFAIGPTGPDFGAVTANGTSIWAAAGNHIIRVSSTGTTAPKRASLPGEAAAVAAARSGVWVATIGQSGNNLTRLDPTTLAVTAHIQVAVQPVALQAGLGAIWLATTGGLWTIDAAHDRLVPGPVPVALPVHLAFVPDRLWLTEQDRLVVAIDRNGRPRARIALPFAPGAVAVTPGRIWVTDNCGCPTGTLALIDTRTHHLLDQTPIGETPVDIAAGHDDVWVATFADRTISHVRPSR